jgi:hypothetical protein
VWMNLVGRFQTQKMRVRREKLKEKMGAMRDKSIGNRNVGETCCPHPVTQPSGLDAPSCRRPG